MSEQQPVPIENSTIQLSQYTKSLLSVYQSVWYQTHKFTGEYLDYSDAASFFALIYERTRNAVEFTEPHLLRRAAIVRILKRKILTTDKNTQFGVIILKELLWGHYIPRTTVTEDDTAIVNQIIDKFNQLQSLIVKKNKIKNIKRLADNIRQLTACEIDDYIHRNEVSKKMGELYYFFQTTKNKILIEGMDNLTKDQYYFSCCESAYLKNDPTYLKYHLLTLHYGSIYQLAEKQINYISGNYGKITTQIDKIVLNPYSSRLYKFAQKLLPPYLIIYGLIDQLKNNTESIITNKDTLSKNISEICHQKYNETGKKLRGMGIRSVVYIFITKMIFIILLEIPISIYLLHNLHPISVVINTLFPPLLMGLIVGITVPPSDSNTKIIEQRVVDIIDDDPCYENKILLEIKAKTTKRISIAEAIFMIIYLLICSLVFIFIYYILSLMQFNIISKVIFIFFVSVVTFFGYRIRKTSKEYALEIKDSLFSHIIDLFFLPLITLGKFLSNEIAKINVFMVIFDVLLDAPIKASVEILERWIGFAKIKKDEIV